MKKTFFIFGFLLIAISFLLLFSNPQSIADGFNKSSVTIEQASDIDTQLACSNCANTISKDVFHFKFFNDSNRFTSFKKPNYLFNSIYKIDVKNHYKHYYIYNDPLNLNIMNC